MLSRGAMSLQESIERFILSPGWGKVRRSRIGGGERSEPIRRMLIIPYDIESQSRNADFNKLAAKPPPQPSGQRPVKLKNPPAVRPVNPKNLFLHNPSTQPAAARRPQPSARRPVNLSLHNPSTQPAAPAVPLFYKICGEAATTTLGTKSRQPSRRRRFRALISSLLSQTGAYVIK